NNDVFVTIQLGKEKYQTSTIKNALNPEWFEECDLPIPNMQTEIEVTVYHHGVISDDFLGYVSIPLWEHKVTETSKSSWIPLHNKPNSKSGDSKYRGELEVKLTFHNQSRTEVLPHGLKKRSSSIRNLATSLGDKFKFARSRSFRENRRDPEGGKVDKSRTLSSRDSNNSLESTETASMRSSSHYAQPSVHFSALDVNRVPWGINPNAP
ncbi:rab11 family-interacting protein 2-like, partial [Physella acuta]|uniref:rab11 family-interacting protein 2-like n=1 Tax=Physella acuta TaxID=109671 RepID=UPI0027DC5ED4